LLGPCFYGRTQTTVSGWVDQGFTWNPSSPADRFNGYLSNNDRANEYQLNQFYVAIERELDIESCSPTFGFKADAVVGTDAFLFHALGWDDQLVSDATSRFYKVAIPQVYAEFFLPAGSGISAKFGKWFGLVGYESGLSTTDFFYSHTLAYNISPYTHTGVLLSTDLTDQLSTSHGLHRGSDVWEDNNNALSYVGSVEWTSSDERTAAYFAILVGPEQDERADWQDIDGAPGPDAPGESLNRVNYSLAFEYQWSDELLLVLSHEYLFQDGSAAFGIDNAEGYGICGYAFYELCDSVSAGARLEIYRDDDAFVSEGFRSANAAAAGVYTNLTLGLNIQQSNCIVWRPEVRWDWQHRDDPTDVPAFDAGNATHQFLFAVDAVMSF
jgi:hypothetical protein